MRQLLRLVLALGLAFGWVIQPHAAQVAEAACSTGQCATLRIEFGAGTGTGLVTSYPLLIACSFPVEPDFDDCVAQFDVGSGLEVVLYLDPGVKSFACIDGGCGGLEGRVEKRITLFPGGDDVKVQPVFTAALDTHVTVGVSGTGSGRVKVCPSNDDDCIVTLGVKSGDCDTHFYTLPGAPIQYTVHVDPAATSFGCIEGTCAYDDVNLQESFPTDGTSVTIATALWLAKPVTVSVSGSGTVASSPAGISCPTACSKFYLPYDQTSTFTTLTATPASGWFFIGWDGACDEFDGPICNLVVGYEGASAGARFGRIAVDPTPTPRPAVTPTPRPTPTQPTGGAGSATQPPPEVTPTPPPAPTQPTGGAGSATQPPPEVTPTPPPTPTAPVATDAPSGSQSIDANATSLDGALLFGGVAAASIVVLAVGFVVGRSRQTSA